MTQGDEELDGLVRKRIRALRVAQGWSLEELAARAHLSQSSLSRIENGRRRLALDQLVTLARALDTTLDQLVETAADDVVISPTIDGAHGRMRWPVKGDPGISVVRQRMTEPPPENREGDELVQCEAAPSVLDAAERHPQGADAFAYEAVQL
ncbi:helix-turn-helix domain-containing protein, partial [Streptomyces prasinus]|uniref:helix-turn-helix domain-containing protein n=1 Tax=Streptomyces prasinus TaxID=67345 RepID=UPI001B8075CD